MDGPASRRLARGRREAAVCVFHRGGARRLDVTSFLGMSALPRGGMPHVVEPAGFEPATFPLRTGRPAIGRRPRSAPDPIRTGDTRIRNPVLYPLSYKGVHPPCGDMRPRTGGDGGTDHGAGMVADGRTREERTRLACHRSRARREFDVACGRRSRHEPLRAPGRTRSGDLPLTRRTLCRLSYRGGCRKPPAVRRRPPRARHGPWDRTGRRACRRPIRGARRFRGAGLRGPAVRNPPGRVRRFARHGGVEPPSTVLETVGLPLSRWRVHCFRSSVFNHAMPAVSAAAWHGMRPRTAGRRNAFRRPSGFGRLRSAGLPD